MATQASNRPLTLPSYPQMIIQAIDALNDHNGSNKTSISKHIESVYGNMPDGHITVLSHHLNKMKETGLLVFHKNNYLKTDPNSLPRRGRGRPPKPKDAASSPQSLGPPKPRGRPPKDPNAPPKPKAVTGSGRPRGRPRKMAWPEGGISNSSSTAAGSGRPRGRPPKVKAQLTEVSV